MKNIYICNHCNKKFKLEKAYLHHRNNKYKCFKEYKYQKEIAFHDMDQIYNKLLNKVIEIEEKFKIKN